MEIKTSMLRVFPARNLPVRVSSLPTASASLVPTAASGTSATAILWCSGTGHALCSCEWGTLSLLHTTQVPVVALYSSYSFVLILYSCILSFCSFVLYTGGILLLF
jgi:Zn-dependent membrane protease YugP